MSIVVYKCDTCKRTIELPRNPSGIETVQRCIITEGCRGKLFQEKVLPDFIRGRSPDAVAGLDDWQQRRILHNHTQAAEKQQWTIEHNMGVYPSIISVFVDRPLENNLENQEEITPDGVQIINENTIVLSFERPWSGIAQLVAGLSQLQSVQPTTITEETEQRETIQLTTKAECTIATRVSLGEPTTMGLRLTYATNQGAEIAVDYIADDQPAETSPWADFDKIIIKGKIYTVRSFNITVPEMATGTINTGSTVTITGLDEDNNMTFDELQKDAMVLLLANPPGDTVDKITTDYVDASIVTPQDNEFAMFFDSGELFIETTVFQPIYPPIRPV